MRPMRRKSPMRILVIPHLFGYIEWPWPQPPQYIFVNFIDYLRQLKTGVGWYWNHILHLICLNQYEIQTQLTRLRILVDISYTLSASRCQAESSTCARVTGSVFKKRKIKNDRKCVDFSTYVRNTARNRTTSGTYSSDNYF